MRLGRWILAAAMMVAGLMPAAASPVGRWEIETGDSRYNVTMCGDGSQLCAELIWLGKYSDTAKNRAYLNTLMLDRAPMVKNHQWKGDLYLYGDRASGTITQIAEDVVELKGCFVFVICRTYKMYRMPE